jgi:hypothetical protein
MRSRLWLILLAAGFALTAGNFDRLTAAEPQRFEFTRLIAHWAKYNDPGYLPFVEEARPEVAQIGFYGAHFWSLAHTPHGKGYPAHFPVQGYAECRQWFANMNRELHKRNVKVVGHMNVKFLVGDPAGKKGGPSGFFDFYQNRWDEKQLGPKPVANPLDLLEKNRDGKPISSGQYSIGGMKEYWGCLSNPHWRTVLKAWTKHGIAQGLDGFMVNYFYRHDCHCKHCVAGFKKSLSSRYTPKQLAEQFKINNLKSHEFDEIVGWHDPKKSTPLRREMLRFSQVINKQAFDEVFVKYGRSLKPNLIVAQWNHLGNFSQINGDERCLLPSAMWGKDETYLWYSTGSAAFFTDLEAGILGEGTLQARYIRGAFDDKPFTLGKYENTRIRVAISELAANGGAPMGFYTRFTDPAARKEIARYYRFLSQHDDVYRGNLPHAEVTLLFPRSQVHAGDVAAVETFKTLGTELLNRHVLFDIRPDDSQPDSSGIIIDPSKISSLPKLPASLSKFDAPKTARVSANKSKSGKELTLHFVNYNREEPTKKRSAGGGIKDEKPIPVNRVSVDIQIPDGKQVATVHFTTPESPTPVALKFQQTKNRLTFTVPKFLVYAVTRLKWK